MSLRRPFENTLWKPGTSYGDALGAEGDCKRRQRDLSRQLTVLVDVLYALVLVEGAEAYRSLFASGVLGHPSRAAPVVLALVLIYFTAIHSFIDYHLASEDQPYQFLDLDRRRNDLWRFYLDVVIVGAYSFLLLECHDLLGAPAANIFPAFAALPVIFGLFIWWGELRRKTGPNPNGRRPYSVWLLALCLSAYAAIALAYALTPSDWFRNAGFLFLALLVMVVYRWLNWGQNRWCVET